MVERRYVPAEMRVDGEGRIEGYAAVFGQWSEDLGGFRERIQQGAFKKTLQEADIRALFNHDPNFVLGRNRSGTLELAEDDHGLHFRTDPPAASWVDGLRESVGRGDIDQGSFGFRTIRDHWTHDGSAHDQRRRTLLEVRLYDVSVVTYPAYPQTSVSARDLMTQFIQQVEARDAAPDLIRELIEQLEAMLPAAPAEGGHPAEGEGHERGEDGAQARLSLLRRRLELAELEGH